MYLDITLFLNGRFTWLMRGLFRTGSQVFPLSLWCFPISVSSCCPPFPISRVSRMKWFLHTHSRVCTRESRQLAWRRTVKNPSKAGSTRECRCRFPDTFLLRTEQGLLKCPGLFFSPQAIWNEHGSPLNPGLFHGLKTAFSGSRIFQGSASCQSTKFMECSEFLWSQITRLYQTEREVCIGGWEHSFQTSRWEYKQANSISFGVMVCGFIGCIALHFESP